MLLFADLAHLVSIGDDGFGIVDVLSGLANSVLLKIIQQSNLLRDFIRLTTPTQRLLQHLFVSLYSKDKQQGSNRFLLQLIIAKVYTLKTM